MKNSQLLWHLARDDGVKLARFCEKYAVNRDKQEHVYQVDGNDYWHQTYYFDNGAWIKVEMLHGTKDRGYTVADCFAIVDYAEGATA